MSANTKIVVLHRKELLYTGIFAALGVLFLILLLMLLLPGKSADASGTADSPDSTAETAMPDNVADLGRSSDTGTVADGSAADINADTVATVGSANVYIPGIYTTELILGSETVSVEVIVSDHEITSLRLVDPDETVTTMYPLLAPTMESLSAQLCETQDLTQVTYSADTRYTSLVLLEAVKAALEKATPAPEGVTKGADDAAKPEASTTPGAEQTGAGAAGAGGTDGSPEPSRTQVPNADLNPAA